MLGAVGLLRDAESDAESMSLRQRWLVLFHHAACTRKVTPAPIAGNPLNPQLRPGALHNDTARKGPQLPSSGTFHGPAMQPGQAPKGREDITHTY